MNSQKIKTAKINLRTGPWRLSDLDSVEKHRHTVFSCFHCGGGSTMGYKLAGFEVLGGVEIDPEMMRLYRANHKPNHSYLMGVKDFTAIPNEKLPSELFDLDILDGSPPCSSFSMAGSREKKWGKNTHFREGQAKQVLDDLFFQFIEVAAKLKPRVVVAENVKGLIQGNARGYVKEIFTAFRAAGYECQLFLLNSAAMGVPQARERTFFIGRRDLNLIALKFTEPPVSILNAIQDLLNEKGVKLPPSLSREWNRIRAGEKKKYISTSIPDKNQPCSTVTSKFTTGEGSAMAFYGPYKYSVGQTKRIQTFPDDYSFLGSDAGYVCGMSVPPFMMQRVAKAIYDQWLSSVL